MSRLYLRPSEEAMLADFFKRTALGETRVEDARQALCSSRFFCPRAVFSFLDRYRTGWLSPFDIENFLSRHYVACSFEEARAIVNEYDENGDGRLSYSEFERFCLSAESPLLQREAKSRYFEDSFDRRGGLEYYVERDFINLLRAELGYQRDTKYPLKCKSIFFKLIRLLGPNGGIQLTQGIWRSSS